jgi:cobalt-zinc-cadmium resistance protein CzcA
MTALLAMLGLLPMALSTDIGSETQRPLAVVVIGGLISATILVLVLLPVLYLVLAEGMRSWLRPSAWRAAIFPWRKSQTLPTDSGRQ